jgi:hypothetical protein
MSDKMDQFEIQREVSLLIDSLPESEQQQVMAQLAARYKMRVSPATSSSPRPTYRKTRFK